MKKLEIGKVKDIASIELVNTGSIISGIQYAEIYRIDDYNRIVIDSEDSIKDLPLTACIIYYKH